MGGMGLACVIAREAEDLCLEVWKRGHARGGSQMDRPFLWDLR